MTGAFGVVIANIEALLDHLMDHETDKMDTLARGLALTYSIEESIEKYDAQLAGHDWDGVGISAPFMIE